MPLARLPWACVWALIRPGCRRKPRASSATASDGAGIPGAPISVMVSPVTSTPAASARCARTSRTRPPRMIVAMGTSIGAPRPAGPQPRDGLQRALPRFGVLDRAPDALGRDGHVEMAHAERRQRVVDRVQEGGQRADGAGLAHALGAERI